MALFKRSHDITPRETRDPSVAPRIRDFIYKREDIVIVIKIIHVMFWIGLLLFGAYMGLGEFVLWGAILAGPVCFFTFWAIYTPPMEVFLECKVNPYRSEESDTVGICEIPQPLLGAYKYKHGEAIVLETEKGVKMSEKTKEKEKKKKKIKIRRKRFPGKYSGLKINIVEHIDHQDKLIYGCWFTELSSWQFLTKREAFITLKKKIENLMDQIKLGKALRTYHFKEEMYKLMVDFDKEARKEAKAVNIPQNVDAEAEIFGGGD